MKKNRFKFMWDLCMLIIFILLLEAKAIGAQFHEIAGLAIGVLFIVHIAVNWDFVKKITQHFFSKHMKFRTKILYVIDVLLLILFLTVIVSGVLMSKVLFPGLYEGNTYVLKTIHQSVTYLTLLFVGLHLGLNWQWVMNTVKRWLGFKSNVARANISRVIAIIILILGIYSMISLNLVSNIARLGQITSMDQSPRFEENILRSETQGGSAISKEGFQDGPGHGAGDGIPSGDRQAGKGPQHAGGSAGSTLLFLKMGQYLSVIGAASFVSYYLDMLLRKKKVKPVV